MVLATMSASKWDILFNHLLVLLLKDSSLEEADFFVSLLGVYLICGGDWTSFSTGLLRLHKDQGTACIY